MKCSNHISMWKNVSICAVCEHRSMNFNCMNLFTAVQSSRILQGHRQEVCGLKWSPDGQSLASGGNDNKLFVWSMVSFQNDFTIYPLQKVLIFVGVTFVAFIPVWIWVIWNVILNWIRCRFPWSGSPAASPRRTYLETIFIVMDYDETGIYIMVWTNNSRGLLMSTTNCKSEKCQNAANIWMTLIGSLEVVYILWMAVDIN